MTDERDCRTCKHNSYLTRVEGAFNRRNFVDWVSCSHPITLAKTPHPEPGDPAWVNMLTSDVPISRIDELADCSAWAEAPMLEGIAERKA